MSKSHKPEWTPDNAGQEFASKIINRVIKMSVLIII